jgi:hypothetical protein
VRLAEQYDDECVGMLPAELGDLVGGVTVPRSDFAQIFARHAIEPVDRCSMIARGREQFIKGGPVVSPVELEADALPQLRS